MTDRAQIQEKVINIVVEQLGVKKEEIQENSSFVSDLGADSLALVEIVMAMEEEFNIEISEEETENIEKVIDAVTMLENKLA